MYLASLYKDTTTRRHAKKTDRNIKNFPQYKPMPSRHVVLACRQAQLHHFWHVDGHKGHFGTSTGTFWHVDGRFWHVNRHKILLFHALLFFLSSLLFGIAGRDFDMSTGASCTSTGAFTILHFTIFLFQPTFGITGRHFGMSTGTFTILHFTIFPFLPTFWHRGASFWHVDGRL